MSDVSEPIRIAVDAMGGDHAPLAVVQGSIMALAQKNLEISLAGQPEVLTPLLRDHAEIRVLPASEVVSMDEHPSMAVRRKRDSSMAVCARACRAGQAQAWISAGNSGAVMATALLVQGRLPAVDRPALGCVIPTTNGVVHLLDVGANSDCSPVQLVQFATMGNIYAREIMGVEEPRVGLLANGEEPFKGNRLIQLTHPLLASSGLNFVGNIEAKELLGGSVDVAVCDGFTGNIVLKTGEAVLALLVAAIRGEARGSAAAMIGARLMLPRLRRALAAADWRESGGVPLLGVDGVVMVAHGRSDGKAICSAIMAAAAAVRANLPQRIGAALRATLDPEPVASSK